MKRLFLTLALVLSVLSVMAADIVPISNAFKRGNVSSLSGSMDKEVDMALPGSSKKCNANDAVSMLNAFFGGNKPTGFIVGKLPTSSGEYRVNVTYRAEGNKAIIQSIRIE